MDYRYPTMSEAAIVCAQVLSSSYILRFLMLKKKKTTLFVIFWLSALQFMSSILFSMMGKFLIVI